MSRIYKPIFIIGTGRCGSSIFCRLLSYHPQIAWTSGFCNYCPNSPWINRLILHLDSYKLSQLIMRKFINPSETTLYWEHLAPGFSFAVKDLKRVDLHLNRKRNIVAALEKLETKKRNRQLHKFTGWPRTDYLLSVFPDAKFIHVYRDGRAVANSLFEVQWWHGWRGPENWIWGKLPDRYQKEWEKSNRSFLVLAAIQWKLLMDSYEEAKMALSDEQFLEIKYEDFFQKPVAVFRRVLDFCEFDNSSKFIDIISKANLNSRNDKWKSSLTDPQQELLENSLGEYCKRYGFN